MNLDLSSGPAVFVAIVVVVLFAAAMAAAK
jgi:hypothetical protein